MVGEGPGGTGRTLGFRDVDSLVSTSVELDRCVVFLSFDGQIVSDSDTRFEDDLEGGVDGGADDGADDGEEGDESSGNPYAPLMSRVAYCDALESEVKA